jgi:tetratricopeptide (TPR) repeat protein
MKFFSVIGLLVLLLSTSAWAQKGKRPAAAATEGDLRIQMEVALIDGQKYLMIDNYAKALELFHAARELDPANPVPHFKIAEVLFQTNAFEQAAPYAEKAVTLDPKNKFYYVLAADIHTARMDLNAAQRTYEKLLTLPETEEYQTSLAMVYKYQGKYDKALESFRKYQARYGTSVEVVREMQKLFLKQNKKAEAIAEWEKLLVVYPGEEQMGLEFVDVLLDMNELARAEMQLKKMLEKDPDSPSAGMRMAELMKKQGKLGGSMEHSRAALMAPGIPFESKGQLLNDFMLSAKTDADKQQLVELLKQVVALHPKEYTAQAFAGDVLFNLGDQREARRYYVKAVRLSPSHFTVWQNILTIESQLNMYDSMIVHAERAIEYFPNQASLYYFGGTGYLMRKKYPQAVRLLEGGKKFVADSRLLSVFHGQLGDAYNAMKDFVKSDAAYEESLKLNPVNDHALNNYSYFLSMRGVKLDRALELSTRLVQEHPNNPTYLDTHGWVLFVMKRYKEARPILQKAASLTEDGTIFEHYGDVLFKLGEEQEAVKQWERAAQFNDASDRIQKKIADRKYYE